ncbi:MAG: hypothetical protein AAGA54_20680 [Myxococcota bacterium]
MAVDRIDRISREIANLAQELATPPRQESVTGAVEIYLHNINGRDAVVAVSMRLPVSVSRNLGRRRDYGPVVARRVLGGVAAKRKIRARSLGAVLDRERSAAQHIISTGRLAAQADSQLRDLLLDVLRLVRTIERDSCAGRPAGGPVGRPWERLVPAMKLHTTALGMAQ